MGAGVYPLAPPAAGCYSCSHPAARPWALGPSRGAVVLGRCGHATGLRSGAPGSGVGTTLWHFPAAAGAAHLIGGCFFDCEAHNSEIRASLKPGPHDEFLLSQSVAEADAGFCTPPLTWSQLLRETQGKPIRFTPRCVIQQSSGKQRIIDNAHAGGQSAFSSESTALRPAQHASLAVSALGFDRAKEVLQHDSLEGGGEDWPNAYRSCPMSADESRACVVCWHHREWGVPAYQLYTGLLFGLPLAVTSFNRYSRFSEALGRRLLFLLVSLYFDDAHLTDWSSSKGSGQQAFRDLNEIMGSPFAEDKRQDMAPTSTSRRFQQMERLLSGFGRGSKRKSRTCWQQQSAPGCCPRELRPSSMAC